MAWRRMRFGMLGLVLVIGAAACDSWRQVGFGPEGQRNNAAERTITPDNVATLELQWETNYGTTDGEPIVDGGKVYVTSYVNGVGTVYALDVDDGSTVWQQEIGPGWPGQIVLLGDDVYGTWSSGCTAGEYRLDAATGDVTTSEETPVRYGTAVPVGDQFVQYAFPTDCVTPAPSPTVVVRDAGSGAVVWHSAPVAGLGRLPTVGDGRVFALHLGGLSAYELAGCGGAAECVPTWTAPSAGWFAQPLYAEGKVFTVAIGSGSGGIAAFDGMTGELAWSGTFGTPGQIAYTDGVVYVGGLGGVTGFTAAGCGQISCGGVWYASTDVISPYLTGGVIAVGGDVLYVHESTARGGAAGTTVAIDVGCRTGCGPAWSVEFVPSAASGLAVAEGHLFAGSSGGPLRVYAPGPP